MSRPDRHYQKIEYGQVNVPATTLCALADYFGVSTDYLLGRRDGPVPGEENQAVSYTHLRAHET